MQQEEMRQTKGHGEQLIRQMEQEQQRGQDGSGSGAGKVRFNFKFDDSAHYDKFMRRPRSQAYIEAIQIIDILSSTDEEIIERLKAVVDEDAVEEFREMTPDEIREELMRSIEEEFAAAELEFKDVPVPPRPEMVITKCYIDGCDVHAIDGCGNILKHFGRGEHGEDIDRGRSAYYGHPGCTCVEIFPDCCRVVMPDGTVEKVE